MTRFEELIAKLSELFELDKADLDFGIHRIIKTKHDQITKYLSERLPERVKSVLGELAQAEVGDSLADLKRQIVQSMGDEAFQEDGSLAPLVANMPLGRQYTAALEASQNARSGAQTEAEVYSHLYEFFSRYYEEGDFISRRRRTAGRETYSVPYDGEEVVLHWANKDQYYIKSTEDLKDYTFTVPINPSGDTARVQFKLTRMDAVQNNNKANRIFVLDEEEGIEATGDTLVIPFHFAEGKKRNQTEEAEWEQAVLDALPEEWQQRLAARDTTYTGDGERSILQKHLRNYTKKNTSDYFIHKDLGGFLRRELDFYIKNEVMYLDDVDSRPADYLEKELRKIKAIRAVAHDLIDFLAQFEDFQKRLWLKKKFVIETNWCITLDRVPEELYPEIAANDAQREEWVRLFAINEITGDMVTPAYTQPLTVEFLKANDKLVLDTAFFPAEFRKRLLHGIDDIEAQTDGLLIHSENFQALNLIHERFREQVQCLYIDPPYNTNATPILYKNEFMSSSWISLMADRLLSGFSLLSSDSSYGVIAIDDHELTHLSQLLEQLFPRRELHRVVVNHYPGSGTGRSNVSRTHEYALFLTPDDQDILRGEAREGGWRERGFCRSGTGDNNYRSGRPNSFYAVLVDESEWEIRGFEPPPDKESNDYPTERTEDGWLRVYPLGSDGSERCWSLSYESAVKAWQEGLLVCTSNGVIKRRYFDEDSRNLLPSVWVDGRYSAVTNGTNLLTSLLGESGLFSYPKSLFTVASAVEAGTFNAEQCYVLDYFGGSGTTGHAVIHLNRQDEASRKYILVEMGEYFDTVLKPRMEKVVYSTDWNEGKPTSRDSGVSHCFKYLRLESYEDGLNNLTLDDRSADLLGLPEDVQDDYLLRYSLDIETRASLLDLERFENPFDYKLKVYNRETGEAEPHPVDLPETFNYLLGLRVRTMQMRDGFLVIEGENPAAETVLVIWRNVHEKDNAALEAFVTGTLRINPADTEYAAIYINGDTTLDDPHKKILLTEQAFHGLMFDVKEL
jgi:adenine-specific DNA-methyltransferase